MYEVGLAYDELSRLKILVKVPSGTLLFCFD